MNAAARIDAFLEMMSAERGAAENTLLSYRRDLEDASREIPGGLAKADAAGLRGYLAGDPAKFAQAFTERLLMYAVNRELEYFDMPQVRAIVRGAAKNAYTLSSIVQGIVRSDAFLTQGPAEAHRPGGATVARR